MKKTTLYIPIILCLILGCTSNNKNNKITWELKKIAKYNIAIPSSYMIKYLSKDSIKGTISNNQTNIDLAIAYIDPNLFSEDGEIIKEHKIKSIKLKLLSYEKGINKDVFVICCWDTLKSTNLFHGATRYSGIVLITKHINRKQKDTLLKIFDSISPSK